MAAKILNIRDIKDTCCELVCDCDENNWKIFIYTSPLRVVIECQACGGEGEMLVDEPN